jgi:hypothetical protein
MTGDLLKALLNPSLLLDVAVVLGVIALFVVFFAWFQRRQEQRWILEVVNFGLWASNHQTVHAGNADNYFDSDLFLGRPQNIGVTVNWFRNEIQKQRRISGKIDRLVFIEKEEGPVGAVTLKDLFSWETKIPGAVVRPRRKGPALKIKLVHDKASALPNNYEAIGQSFRSENAAEHVVLVSDVATTGTTILKAADLIEHAGGRVDAAFVLYDREETGLANKKGIEKLQERNIRLVAMLKASGMKKAIRHTKQIREVAEKKGVMS